MNCANCEHNDGMVYTSFPPKYKCTITNEFHFGDDDCNVEFAPVKHGRWIKSKKSDYNWECSNCGYGLTDYRTTYCYDCGARMDENGEDSSHPFAESVMMGMGGEEKRQKMNIDDRYSATVWADEQAYIDYADYRNFVANLIQEKLSKELITALCTKGSIVAIKGDSTTRKDESTGGIYCRQDIYVKELVRCKDCKWYRNRFNQHYCCLSAIDCPLPDDYCSRAERKNEVDNG